MPTYDAEKCRGLLSQWGQDGFAGEDFIDDMAGQLEAATQEVERLTRENEAMAPLRSLLDDWRWAEMDRHDIQDDDLAQRIVDAFATAERNLATIRHAAGVEGEGE